MKQKRPRALNINHHMQTILNALADILSILLILLIGGIMISI